jgi:phosphate-starvation-inducible protein E
VRREQSIIQTKVVLLIALLVLARKFIILDIKDSSAAHLAALAAVTPRAGRHLLADPRAG